MISVFLILNIIFVVLPLAGVILSNFISLRQLTPYVKCLACFFIIHNICYAVGYSIKGDIFDYLIFTIEYPFFTLCMILWMDIRKNIYTKILSIIGYIVAFVGVIIGIFSLVFYSAICKEYISDRTINFIHDGKAYETRIYRPNLSEADVEIDVSNTYLIFNFLPIEKFISQSSTMNN